MSGTKAAGRQSPQAARDQDDPTRDNAAGNTPRRVVIHDDKLSPPGVPSTGKCEKSAARNPAAPSVAGELARRSRFAPKPPTRKNRRASSPAKRGGAPAAPPHTCDPATGRSTRFVIV